MSLYTYNKEGQITCKRCSRKKLRHRYGKVRFHFAPACDAPCSGGTVSGLTAEDLYGGLHPTTCRCHAQAATSARPRQVAR